jgi:hypothetical protein
MHTAPLKALFLAAALGLASVPARGAVRDLGSPAAPGSSAPNLRAGSDGRVYLSWVEPGATKRFVLRFAALDGETWSAPRDIATGDDWFVNWADFPSVVPLGGGRLAAHWLVKNGEGTFAYSVHTARSADGGRTWRRPVVPHRDTSQTEHGFVSLVPWDGDRVAAVWLDGRQFGMGHGHTAASEEMTLRFAALGADGRLTAEAVVDGRVCECCQTSAARTSDGLVVVYRDRSADEVRDVGVVRLAGGRWTEPAIVHRDGWKIEGCPVNGPSVAADGRRVAVAWYTAAGDTPRVRVAFSTDAAASFGAPVEVDDGRPMGRVDVELLADGSALVSWLERLADGGEIRVRRVYADGRRGQAVTIAKTTVERASGFPQMVRTGNRVVFAWTEARKPSAIRTAVLPVSTFQGGRAPTP